MEAMLAVAADYCCNSFRYAQNERAASQVLTMHEQLTLRFPKEDEEPEFLRAHRATSPEVPYFLHYYSEDMRFFDYLEVLADQQRGKNLPPNHVPSTFLFAFVGPRIVGRVSIRHSLNDFLERVGGHVGYVVVPEFRRRGYATEMLRQAVLIARESLGLRRVLVTCDDDNVGSIRTIEKNGGQLENVVTGHDLEKAKRRYWIATG
jgi:predicted acetyltransferase